MMLDWPEERIDGGDPPPKWDHPESNLCLDFHGDPRAARLVVFSDGNHHMALIEALQYFHENNPEVEQIFYATTPPGPILQLLRHGSLQIGNFILSVAPHVFISPPHVLDDLVHEGHMRKHIPFVRNRGSAFIVRKGNPKNIRGVADLARDDVRLFLSNPETETVSYQGYVDTLKGLAAKEGIPLAFSTDENVSPKVVYGKRIHHREAPQALADGDVDAAIVYYHLALRYKHIFPELFEIVYIHGDSGDPDSVPENIVTATHVGMIGDGGQWGAKFFGFLLSDTVSDMYARHGLVPAR